VLSVGNPVEPKLAEPSQFLAGCGGEHFGFEAHAVAAIRKQADHELCAQLGSAFSERRGSRSVPPASAATTPRTPTPKTSIRWRVAAIAPETANPIVPMTSTTATDDPVAGQDDHRMCQVDGLGSTGLIAPVG
jgi:hypothetical protein